MQQPVTIFYASFRGWQSNHHDHVCMFNKLDDSYLLVYCGFIGNFDSLIVVRAADLCTHRALTSSPASSSIVGLLVSLGKFRPIKLFIVNSIIPASICGGWRYWAMLGLIWPKFWPNLHNFPLPRLAGRDNRPLLHFSVSLSRNQPSQHMGICIEMQICGYDMSSLHNVWFCLVMFIYCEQYCSGVWLRSPLMLKHPLSSAGTACECLLADTEHN